MRPIARGALASFIGGGTAERRSSEHVVFIGQDQHLHELRFDGIWRDHDLTALTGVRPPASGSPLTGFWDTSVDSRPNGPSFEHVLYIDSTGKVCELLYDGTEWDSNSIPLQRSSEQWAPRSPLTSCSGGATSSGSAFYIGKDGHVHELWFDRHGWHTNDLTMLAGQAPSPVTSPMMTPLTSFRGPPSSNRVGGTQHVLFIGEEGHVQELWFDGTRWHRNDLNKAAGASTRPMMSPTRISPLTGFFGGATRRQHVFFIGEDEHVHELWSDGQRWHTSVLTRAGDRADIPAARPVSSLASCYWPEEGTEHVFFIGASGDLWELWFDGSWHPNDLTQAGPNVDVPALRPMSPLTSYYWPEEGTEHIFFIGAGGDLWELWYDASWHSNDLTKAT